jgi:hypothetical protein
MDLEKGKESSLSFQAHGLCGLTVENLNTTMELVASRLMVFIHSLSFKHNKKMSGWESSSEIQTFNLQLSQRSLMETIL